MTARLQEAAFKAGPVQQLLRSMLAERLKGQSYDPVKGAQVGAWGVRAWLDEWARTQASSRPPHALHPALPAARPLQLVKQLADDVRERVKQLGFDRYKLVVQVELGEKKGQAVNMVSRCLWDTTTDGFASESYETETLFCNCQVRRRAAWSPQLCATPTLAAATSLPGFQPSLTAWPCTPAGLCAVFRVALGCSPGACITAAWVGLIFGSCGAGDVQLLSCLLLFMLFGLHYNNLNTACSTGVQERMNEWQRTLGPACKIGPGAIPRPKNVQNWGALR